MERTLTLPTQILAPAASQWKRALWRILPLWRHLVWLGALFVVLAFWVRVRVDVQQLRTDLDRNTRMMREARITHDRLTLEMDARRRASAVEAVAAQLAMTSEVTVVRVR